VEDAGFEESQRFDFGLCEDGSLEGNRSRRLRPEIETILMIANETYSFISSRLVKEVFSLGGNISGLVPPTVEARLQRRLAKVV